MTFWLRAVSFQRVMLPEYRNGKENLLLLKNSLPWFFCIKNGHITGKRLRRIHPRTTHSGQRDSHLSNSSEKHITINTKVCISFFLLAQYYTAKAYQFGVNGCMSHGMHVDVGMNLLIHRQQFSKSFCS